MYFNVIKSGTNQKLLVVYDIGILLVLSMIERRHTSISSSYCLLIQPYPTLGLTFSLQM